MSRGILLVATVYLQLKVWAVATEEPFWSAKFLAVILSILF